MAKAKSSIENVRALRESLGLNQSAFWSKFGVTQSGGSRYENGRNIPKPIKVLLQANLDGALDDATLEKLMKKVSKS